jgi:hypothetical protein
VTDTITLTDPITGKTWTSGKRGRKPKFVMELEAAGTVIPKKINAQAPTKKDSKKLPAVPGALRIWKYVGQSGEEGDNDEHQRTVRCMIVAANPIAAITTANPTFINPMMPDELEIMWKEVDDTDLVADIHASGIDVTKPAIYESVGKGWQERKPKENTHA